MTPLRPFVLLLLALAGCSVSGCSLIEPPKSPPGSAQRQCEDAADADPRVRDYFGTIPSNTAPLSFTDDYRAFRARVVSDCLRVRSGRPAGGVERLVK